MRLPEFLTELSPVRETLAALEQGENAMAEAVAEKNGQVCVETATGGLTLWERDYGLPVREGAAVEDRRAAVRAAMAGGRTLNSVQLDTIAVTACIYRTRWAAATGARWRRTSPIGASRRWRWARGVFRRTFRP